MTGGILFFTESAAYGGDDTVLIELLRHWPGSERLVMALNRSHPGRSVYEKSLAGRAELISINEPTLDEIAGFDRLLRPAAACAASSRLARRLRELAPDRVVLSSGGFPCSALTFRMLLAAKRASLPVFLVVHGHPPEARGPRRAYLRAAGALTLGLCDGVAAVSGFCARAVESFAFARPGSVKTIPNGLGERSETMAAGQKRAALGIPADGPLIGAIGNIVACKGYDVLLRAMRLVLAARPDARLVVIGAPVDAAVANKLKELAALPPLAGRVKLAGFLPEAGQYAECFDVCVMPSVAEETFGLSALESMRYARPLIASRVGGLPETVGDAGELVPPGNESALADALIRRLESGPDRADERGPVRWRERFTAGAMALRWRDFVLEARSNATITAAAGKGGADARPR